jgi:hypothetical protein
MKASHESGGGGQIAACATVRTAGTGRPSAVLLAALPQHGVCAGAEPPFLSPRTATQLRVAASALPRTTRCGLIQSYITSDQRYHYTEPILLHKEY